MITQYNTTQRAEDEDDRLRALQDRYVPTSTTPGTTTQTTQPPQSTAPTTEPQTQQPQPNVTSLNPVQNFQPSAAGPTGEGSDVLRHVTGGQQQLSPQTNPATAPYASPTTTAVIGAPFNPSTAFQYPGGMVQPTATDPSTGWQPPPMGAETAPVAGAPPADWYNRLWGMVSSQPQYQAVNPAMGPDALAAQQAAAAQRSSAGSPLGSYGQIAGRGADELALRNTLLGGAMQGSPTYAYGDVNAVNNVAGLDDRLQQFAMAGLDAPGRYDTDLFNQLMGSAMDRLRQEQSADELRLTRRSNQLLGPNSGQLKNEFIDLSGEFDRNRSDLALQLLREAALTNAQDRSSAADIARGVSGDVFGRGYTLRGEERGERDFDFATDRATESDRLANLLAQSGVQSQVFGQDQSVRNEQRADRQFDFGRDVTNRDIAARAAGMEQSAAESNFGMDAALRGEQRAERDFGVQDRLRSLGELQDFAGLDRQLNRDAVDDYYRQFNAELASNESLARLAQSEFANNIALAQLMANLPATGDAAVDGAGGGSTDPMDWQFGAGAQTVNNIQQQAIRGQMTPEQAYQALQQAGAPDSVIRETMAKINVLHNMLSSFGFRG